MASAPPDTGLPCWSFHMSRTSRIVVVTRMARERPSHRERFPPTLDVPCDVRLGSVGAPRPGPNGVREVSTQIGLDLADLLDRGPNAIRHRGTGLLGARPGGPGATPQTEGLTELLHEEIELELRLLGPGTVVVGPRLVDVVLELDDAGLVLAARRVIE